MNTKIGIFDSGLGGLIIAQAIIDRLPSYDYLYLGDTLHLPYGDKTADEVYELTQSGITELFKRGCLLVIVACNTASAEALRRLQQEYLPVHYPDRHLLGVIVPTIEAVADNNLQRVGILATAGTVTSHAYTKELHKIDPRIQVVEVAAPPLVPLIESNSLDAAETAIYPYLQRLRDESVQAIVLGCTHYGALKVAIKHQIGDSLVVIAQEEIVPDKLADYLSRHPEIEARLSRNRDQEFLVTQITPHFKAVASTLFRRPIEIVQIAYSN